jgi:hypothetical protein
VIARSILDQRPITFTENRVGQAHKSALNQRFDVNSRIHDFISCLSARSADRRVSTSETAGTVLAKIKDHSKEREVQFQNRQNRVSIRFLI